MLDLSHPRTPHIFAAARQEDLILDCCKQMKLSHADDRRFLLEVVRPAFAALRWLSTARFAADSRIAASVDALEQQVEQLAALPVRSDEGELDVQCPACGGGPTVASNDSPLPYCPQCLEVVMPAVQRIRSSEEGFGTDAN